MKIHVRNKKRVYLVCTAVFLLLVVLVLSAGSSAKIIIKDGSICSVSGSDIRLSRSPFTFRGDIYLPIDDVLPPCGVTMGWDENLKAIVCVKGNNEYKIFPESDKYIKNGSEKTLKLRTIMRDGITCISETLINEITGYDTDAYSKPQEYVELSFEGESNKWDNNGKEAKLKEAPFRYGKDIYVSADDILPQLGFKLGWKDDIGALVCIKNDETDYIISGKNNIWVNETEYLFDLPSLVLDNALYISGSMLEKIAGGRVFANGDFKLRIKRDLLENTIVGDDYRLVGSSVAAGGGVTVIDGFGMEFLGINNYNAQVYAAVINSVAKAVPNVQVYNIAVPTAAEFYAPERMKINQTAGIREIYKNLDESVIPVNAVSALYNHAGEKLYFKTDHHWTQRGAYWVYKDFMALKGVSVPDISEFENKPGYGFVGSLAGFARGTAAESILRANSETVERFIPKYATVGTVYEDMNMTKTLRTVKAVNTASASYMAFIGGDGPVTVFYTDAPSNEVAVIVKESYGNAFATWALNNYKMVYVIDPRKFNGFGGKYYQKFNIKTFCDNVKCNDLIMINYPGAISSGGIRQAILDMTK